MASRARTLFEFDVHLRYVEPRIWRRFHIRSDCSFFDLHLAIQGAMGWMDTHLFMFACTYSNGQEQCRIGYPDPHSRRGPQDLVAWRHWLRDFKDEISFPMLYLYDFGDGWEHSLNLVREIPAEVGARYPKLVDGARACPPEDCGGPPGYQELVENPDHASEHGFEFDSDRFEISEATFASPKKALEQAKLHFGE